jgi:hypothetical protein
MSLNKNNGCREAFIPENDLLLEIDISAYHPTIAAKLINYDFMGKNPYEYLAEQLNQNVVNIKEKMFNILYGGNFSDVIDLEFFKKLKDFIEKMWITFNKQGYIEEKTSNYIFYKNKLKNLNKYKLFNYYLQCIETSQNVLIMWEIIKLLKNKKTKLIHYCYDSFLFDFDEKEKNCLENIKKIFIMSGLNIKIKEGKNYNF